MKRWNDLHNGKMRIRGGWGGGDGRIKLQYVVSDVRAQLCKL